MYIKRNIKIPIDNLIFNIAPDTSRIDYLGDDND